MARHEVRVISRAGSGGTVVEGATLRRLRRSWVSTVTSLCALAIAVSLMSIADVGGSVTRSERVVNLGGARNDHSGLGNAMFPPVEKTRPSAPPVAHEDAPTPVAGAQGEANLLAASGDEMVIAGEQASNTSTSTTSTTSTTVASTPTSTTPTTQPPVAYQQGQTDGRCDANGKPIVGSKPPAPKKPKPPARTPKKPPRHAPKPKPKPPKGHPCKPARVADSGAHAEAVDP
jgi:hypothetical protein